MADRLTPEELAAIHKTHDIEESCLAIDFDAFPPMYDQAHRHRAALLQHVEALEQELFDVESERENLFNIFEEHCENEERLEQEVERLRDEAVGNGYAADGLGRLMDEWRERAEAAERKLARLVEGLKSLPDLLVKSHDSDEWKIVLSAERVRALIDTATGEGK